jgi:putative acetyltransferase
MSTCTIRAEEAHDRARIRHVVKVAFGRADEAQLVEALRASPAFIPGLSLVAFEANEVVGHILFTRLVIKDVDRVHEALALAPLAVVPARQNRGIGSALVRRGVEDARTLGHQRVVVVGHGHYYPRFGFQPAQALGIRAPFEVAPENFLVLGLLPGAWQGVHGIVEYPPAFQAQVGDG